MILSWNEIKDRAVKFSKEWKDKFTASCKEAVEVAKRTNAKWMTTVPGNFDRSLPMDIQTGNVIEGLRAGVEILEKNNLITVLEPLSDTPNLFLRYSDQAYAICKAINSPACKILFDMYHLQKNEGNIINNINRCWSEIAYFQIGDNPGRNEPGSGEMNYRNIFKHINAKSQATEAYAKYLLNTCGPKESSKMGYLPLTGKILDLAKTQVEKFSN